MRPLHSRMQRMDSLAGLPVRLAPRTLALFHSIKCRPYLPKSKAMAGKPSREAAIHKADERATSLMRTVRDLALELHPRQMSLESATLDSSLDRDLGLDSLARAELLTRVEREFGVALSEQVFAEAETPRDLLRAVRAGPVRVVRRHRCRCTR